MVSTLSKRIGLISAFPMLGLYLGINKSLVTPQIDGLTRLRRTELQNNKSTSARSGKKRMFLSSSSPGALKIFFAGVSSPVVISSIVNASGGE